MLPTLTAIFGQATRAFQENASTRMLRWTATQVKAETQTPVSTEVQCQPTAIRMRLADELIADTHCPA